MSDWSNNPSLSPFPLSCSPEEAASVSAAGRLDALVAFVKAEQSTLLRFLTWKVRCPSAAADLVQEVYLRIITMTRPESIRDPRGFLYTTAKHLAIDYLRQKDRALSRSQSLDHAAGVPTSVPDAEITIDAKRRLAMVLRAIDELPLRRRAVFIMFKFEHKTYGEIAQELNISIRTVEHHLSKAMAYCRARFEALNDSA